MDEDIHTFPSIIETFLGRLNKDRYSDSGDGLDRSDDGSNIFSQTADLKSRAQETKTDLTGEQKKKVEEILRRTVHYFIAWRFREVDFHVDLKKYETAEAIIKRMREKIKSAGLTLTEPQEYHIQMKELVVENKKRGRPEAHGHKNYGHFAKSRAVRA